MVQYYFIVLTTLFYRYTNAWSPVSYVSFITNASLSARRWIRTIQWKSYFRTLFRAASWIRAVFVTFMCTVTDISWKQKYTYIKKCELTQWTVLTLPLIRHLHDIDGELISYARRFHTMLAPTFIWAFDMYVCIHCFVGMQMPEVSFRTYTSLHVYYQMHP